MKSVWGLLGGWSSAEPFEAVARPPLQRRWRIGIESYEIPERLAAVPAQPRQSVSVRVGMPRHIFANRSIRMFRQLVQCLRVGTWMLADQPEQIKILFRRLLHKSFQHFRFGVRAQHQS